MSELGKRYRCDFCGRTFQREVWYKKHTCTKKARFENAHKMEIILAYKLFNYWCRRQGFQKGRGERTFEDFIKSPYYNAFTRLAEYSKRVYLISAFQYLNWLIEMNVPEREWLSPRKLENYRLWTRKRDNPKEQCDITYRNAATWCEQQKVPVREFFRSITPGDALNWVRLNKLLPWVLFGYDRAVVDLLSRFDDEKLYALGEFLNNDHWIERVNEEADETMLVQDTCQRLFGA